ncbi:hypothetical protein EYZ11_012218 [Aspergillus tanneri]|uniref:Uncharacterized protein n=1 Tax=Aspergillus tanneri TaxID=1220188 RepID=A0A4S3J0S9_9EURO|nr:hypothetical protein EYZ11_012218 [Aspergillus tanneri]
MHIVAGSEIKPAENIFIKTCVLADLSLVVMDSYSAYSNFDRDPDFLTQKVIQGHN